LLLRKSKSPKANKNKIYIKAFVPLKKIDAFDFCVFLEIFNIDIRSKSLHHAISQTWRFSHHFMTHSTWRIYG